MSIDEITNIVQPTLLLSSQQILDLLIYIHASNANRPTGTSLVSPSSGGWGGIGESISLSHNDEDEGDLNCPGLHGLHIEETSHDNFLCDICDKSVPQGYNP